MLNILGIFFGIQMTVFRATMFVEGKQFHELFSLILSKQKLVLGLLIICDKK